jgi:hypothetical protein
MEIINPGPGYPTPNIALRFSGGLVLVWIFIWTGLRYFAEFLSIIETSLLSMHTLSWVARL